MRYFVYGLTMEPISLCWQCGNTAVCELVCPVCSSLQKPPTGFFQFFGIPEELALDVNALQSRFYELSRKVHPDHFAQKSAGERECSLEATSILNDGYRTLRDPIRRAEYVLDQHGFDIGEQRGNNVPPELLEEVFELNEALEEIRSGDDSARPQLEKAEQDFTAMLTASDNELQQEFLNFDRARSDDVLKKIRGILNRRKYIQNLVSEVHKELSAVRG